MRIINSTTFGFDPKIDPADRITVEVGDSKQELFYPQIKVMRWDNEVNLSIRLIDPIQPATLKIEGEKVLFDSSSMLQSFYELPDSEQCPEGGIEFDITLKEKPVKNILTFSLQSKGLEFLFQPLLPTVQEDGMSYRPSPKGTGSIIRMAGVGGGYAVYHANPPINIEGGKLYRCGKVGMIYRPRLVDAIGKKEWGELNIDIVAGILTVTIPQKFLNQAVYPIQKAAGLTFGYTTLGGTVDCTGGADYLYYIQLNDLSPAGTNTDTNHSYGIPAASAHCNMASYNVTMGLYNESGGNPNAKLVQDGSVTATTATTDHFITGPAVSYGLAASTQYWIGAARTAGGHGAMWDGSGTKKVSYKSGTSLPDPAAPDGDVATNVRPSAYVTYTAAGGGLPIPVAMASYRQRRN